MSINDSRRHSPDLDPRPLFHNSSTGSSPVCCIKRRCQVSRVSFQCPLGLGTPSGVDPDPNPTSPTPTSTEGPPPRGSQFYSSSSFLLFPHEVPPPCRTRLSVSFPPTPRSQGDTDVSRSPHTSTVHRRAVPCPLSGCTSGAPGTSLTVTLPSKSLSPGTPRTVGPRDSSFPHDFPLPFLWG